MNLIDFKQTFPTESECRLFFKNLRDHEGITCKRCKYDDHYWLPSKQMYECKKCGKRISLRSGTTMENSKLPFRIWFIAMHLMVSTKKNISALEVQRQIGHKYYEPVWAMMQKIRRAMGNHDEAKYPIFLKEAFISSFPAFKVPETRTKRLRDRQKEHPKCVPVAVMVQETTTGISRTYVGPLRMAVLKGSEAQEKQTPSFPPKKKGPNKSMRKLVKAPLSRAEIILRQEGKVEGIVVENAVLGLLGIHFGVSTTYIQNYLNEFCYKLNRRHRRNSIFLDLISAISSHWQT